LRLKNPLEFYQGIHLVLATHGAKLEKRKTHMHGEHHNGGKKNGQGVGALLQYLHKNLVPLND
jgi:hypothetical protein